MVVGSVGIPKSRKKKTQVLAAYLDKETKQGSHHPSEGDAQSLATETTAAESIGSSSCWASNTNLPEVVGRRQRDSTISTLSLSSSGNTNHHSNAHEEPLKEEEEEEGQSEEDTADVFDRLYHNRKRQQPQWKDPHQQHHEKHPVNKQHAHANPPFSQPSTFERLYRNEKRKEHLWKDPRPPNARPRSLSPNHARQKQSRKGPSTPSSAPRSTAQQTIPNSAPRRTAQETPLSPCFDRLYHSHTASSEKRSKKDPREGNWKQTLRTPPTAPITSKPPALAQTPFGLKDESKPLNFDEFPSVPLTRPSSRSCSPKRTVISKREDNATDICNGSPRASEATALASCPSPSTARELIQHAKNLLDQSDLLLDKHEAQECFGPTDPAMGASYRSQTQSSSKAKQKKKRGKRPRTLSPHRRLCRDQQSKPVFERLYSETTHASESHTHGIRSLERVRPTSPRPARSLSPNHRKARDAFFERMYRNEKRLEHLWKAPPAPVILHSPTTTVSLADSKPVPAIFDRLYHNEKRHETVWPQSNHAKAANRSLIPENRSTIQAVHKEEAPGTPGRSQNRLSRSTSHKHTVNSTPSTSTSFGSPNVVASPTLLPMSSLRRNHGAATAAPLSQLQREIMQLQELAHRLNKEEKSNTEEAFSAKTTTNENRTTTSVAMTQATKSGARDQHALGMHRTNQVDPGVVADKQDSSKEIETGSRVDRISTTGQVTLVDPVGSTQNSSSGEASLHQKGIKSNVTPPTAPSPSNSANGAVSLEPTKQSMTVIADRVASSNDLNNICTVALASGPEAPNQPAPCDLPVQDGTASSSFGLVHVVESFDGSVACPCLPAKSPAASASDERDPSGDRFEAQCVKQAAIHIIPEIVRPILGNRIAAGIANLYLLENLPGLQTAMDSAEANVLEEDDDIETDRSAVAPSLCYEIFEWWGAVGGATKAQRRCQQGQRPSSSCSSSLFVEAPAPFLFPTEPISACFGWLFLKPQQHDW